MQATKNHADDKTNPFTGEFTLHSQRPIDLSHFSKDDVRTYFSNTYDTYESLFSTLKSDAVYYLCPDRLRLPLIFYYGHTAAVYVNKLVLSGLIEPSERVNREFETTFETGVDEMSWDDIESYRMGGNYRWPSVAETREFRRRVRALINDVIERTELQLPVNWDSKWWGLFMGFEHERIHFETSSVLIRQLPIDLVTKPSAWVYAPFKLNKSADFIPIKMVKVEATDVLIGKSYEFPSYGWDNEYGRVECRVSAFEASAFKITNEQFFEFVLSDGYLRREFWSDEGWQWVQFKQARHPLFWVCPLGCKSGCGGRLAATYTHCQESHFNDEQLRFFTRRNNSGNTNCNGNNINHLRCINESLDENANNSSAPSFPYKLRLMYDVIDMPFNWPVEINYHEAKAFSRWKGQGYRLLSEAEHHAIRDNDVLDLKTTSDVIFQKNAKANLNMTFGSSSPVDFYPPNRKGFSDVFGNVWEWCEDNFNGLPGGKTHYMYDDFSTPCYDGRHNMIMGGSWVSTGDEASCFARFMFRRHFYQHAGFRLARSLPTRDGLKPNPQIRLVADRIFLQDGVIPENTLELNPSEIEIGYYDTANEQYKYDSHLHPNLPEEEMLFEHSGWFEPFMQKLSEILIEQKVNPNLAIQLGVTSGRVTFELAKKFNEVIGLDFCAKFVYICNTLQAKGKLDLKLESQEKQPTLSLDVRDNMSASKAVFKQMTWISNEIPKGDLFLFTMLDRVMNPLSWLKRLREVVQPDGILVIHTRKPEKWNEFSLGPILNTFQLVRTVPIADSDMSVWRLRTSSDQP